MNDVERELKALGERAGREATYHSVPARRIVRRARVRRSLAVVAPTAAVVLVAAVAYPALVRDRGGVGVVPVDLAAVARTTEDAKTARVEMRVEVEVGGQVQTTDGVGEIDFARRRAHLRLKGATPAGTGPAEIIAIGNTTYQRTTGSEWMRFDKPTSAFGAGAGPADILPYLEEASDEVTNLGTEELDGVEVTHYRAVLDESEYPVPASVDVELDPMEVWVDDLGRLRKLAFGSEIDGGDGLAGRLDMTMRLWDFGIPVDVAAPDPEDVVDGENALDPGSSASGSADDKGSFSEGSFPPTTIVFGEEGMDGPHLMVGDDDGGVCAQSLPLGASKVSLVHEKSRYRLLVMAGDELRDHEAISQSGGCSRDVLAHEEVDALKRDPADYLLIIETNEDETVTVPLDEVAGVEGNKG
ncbi:MAG TPA: hypothetical protein VG318_09670 [Actinomycetota bacterium]|nr:hypothetical protein [Actinomycetota bacterium]